MSSPAGVTPRKLCRLSAEKFADIIATKSLPLIELYISDKEFYEYYYFPDKLAILKHLDRLRTWFWSHPWLGPSESPLRYVVDGALKDVIEYHSEVMEGPRDQQLFTIFIFQLLFQYEAGKLVTGHVYGINHLCNDLLNLLEYLNPLDVTAFDTTNIMFLQHESFPELLRYMPYLKSITICTSDNKKVLDHLIEHCAFIENITIVGDRKGPCKITENNLCKLFFCGEGQRQVLSAITRNQFVNLSFPRLKSVSFVTSVEAYELDMKYLMLSLEYFYPGLKTEWVCPVRKGTPIGIVLRWGTECPSFVRENPWLHFNGISFSFTDVIDDRQACWRPPFDVHPVFLRADYIRLTYDLHVCSGNPHFIRVLLENFDCHSLKVIYRDLESLQLSQTFGEASARLKELYLDGILYSNIDGEQLYLVLESCVNLSILSITLDLIHDPQWKKMNEIPKLQVLSFKLHPFYMWESFPFNDSTDDPIDDAVNDFIEINSMNPNLPAYMGRDHHFEEICQWRLFDKIYCITDETMSSSWTSEGNQLQERGIQSVRESIFGKGPFKYDIPLEKTKSHGFGVLSFTTTESKRRRKPLSCGHIKEPFCFYGKSSYGYESSRNRFFGNDDMHGSGFCRESKFMTTHSGNVGYNLAMHGNVPFDDKIFLDNNHLATSTENRLQQWRLDMNFDAPLNILESLISAAPNLRILEIPDLRFSDVEVLFNEESLAKNLSKIHTVHLSSQFTTPLAMGLTKFPSLRTLRVDPCYGLDNFLRFKRALRRTNLYVEIGESLVYPGSGVERSINLIRDN